MNTFRRLATRELGGAPTWFIAAAVVAAAALCAVIAFGGSAVTRPKDVDTIDGEVGGGATPDAALAEIALFVGDSQSAGFGASSPDMRWTTIVTDEWG